MSSPTGEIKTRTGQYFMAVWLVLTCVCAVIALALRGEPAQQLASRYFSAITGRAARDVSHLVEPPQSLLHEFALQAQNDMPSAERLDRMGGMLAARLRFETRLKWLSFSDDATGRFIGARREDDKIILNHSDPSVDGGRPQELLVAADGSMTRLDTNLPGGYDPRTKEWYKRAVADKSVFWTLPFKFNEGIVGITAALAARGRDGKPTGVFTADFYLNDLSNLLNTMTEDGNISLFLLNAEGNVIATPAAQSADAETLLTAALNAGKQSDSAKSGRTFEFESSSQRYDASVEAIPISDQVKWNMVIVAPESHLLGADTGRRQFSFYLGIAASVMAVAFTVYFAVRVLRRGRDNTVERPSTHITPPASLANKIPTSVMIGGVAAQPVDTADGLDAARRASLTLESLFRARDKTVRIDDLSGERLLAMSKRIEVDGRLLPSLGGIPLLHKLGSGAMGSVYLGVHPRLRLEVAVKVMSFTLAERNNEWVKRFYREGQMAAMLSSPNLVHVHDVNEEGGLFYMVMDLVRGMSAHSHLQQVYLTSGEIPESECLDICIAAARGLAAAHEGGIVHRDIKPDNILIPFTDDNRTLHFAHARLTDLGLARYEMSNGSLTATETMMGTIGFMAPEQARDSKRASKQSDVFSMGATLYSLLCGDLPFNGTSPLDTLMMMVEKPHVPVQERRMGLSPGVVKVVDKCLEKDPLNRYPSAVELLRDLEICRQSIKTVRATVRQ